MIDSLCRFILFRLLGWRNVGNPPQELDKYLFVALPHTSNWDFVYGWMTSRALGLRLTFFVKDVFCKGPLKYLCRFFGAAPVNRSESTNFVRAVTKQFAESSQLIALITPEGTRKRTEGLKSGYYHLAKTANIPIVVAGPNYREKTFTILPPRAALDTFEEDQANLIAFSKTMDGKYPNKTFAKNEQD